jgi:glycosyltransferase involved in cell wall biosynthesis
MDENASSDRRAESGSRSLKKPRILFLVTESYYFASHKLGLAEAAVRAGFEVTVAARSPEDGSAGDANVTMIPLGWNRSGSTIGALLSLIPDVFRVMRVIALVKPDVIHNISLKPAIIGSIAAFGRDVTVVNSINGFGFVFQSRSFLARCVQFGCRVVLKCSAKWNDGRIVLQNKDDADYVKARMQINDERVHLIRGSGIDPDAFPPTLEPASPPIRFLVLARLLKIKGIHVVVDAHERLRARGLDADLVLCGGLDPGNPSSFSRDDMDRWSQIPGITVLGHVQDVRPVISGSHVVVHPALGGEGLPRALLEAAALERPLLVTDIPGNREVVIQDQTGMLVPPNDPDALADAMAWIASHPHERGRWGKAARQLVLDEFTSVAVKAAHEALYAELQGNTNAS